MRFDGSWYNAARVRANVSGSGRENRIMRVSGAWTAVAAALAVAGGAAAQDGGTDMKTVDGGKYVIPAAPDCGLQQAIDFTPPGGTLALPKGTYVLQRSLVLHDDMTLLGAGADTVLTILPEPPCSELADDAEKGATAIRVKDPKGFKVGMQVTVRSAEKNAWDETFAIVTGRDANTLTLDTPMRHTYAAAKVGQTGNLFPAIMAEGRKNVTIDSVRIVGPARQPMFNRFVLDAIHLVRCENVLITRCIVERWHSDGFSVQGGRNARVMDNVARRCAGHGFHPGTGLQDSFWSGNVGEENGAFGLYYCWDNKRVIVSHNTFARNATYGVGRLGDGRDTDCLVYDNVLESNGAAGVHSGMFGDCKLNFIYGNKIIDNSTRQPGPGVLLQKSSQTVVAMNEVFCNGPQPMPYAGIEELGDGTNGNYIVANAVRGYRDKVLKRGKDTVVEAEYPGSIPPDRLAVLDGLLARDRANWEDWKTNGRKQVEQ